VESGHPVQLDQIDHRFAKHRRERGERALLANAVFHIPLESKFVPYCGFGFGGTNEYFKP